MAPVRSSKTDQIHNSIVATLLALMDGLDSRGRVVVLGATNRVDAIDGALRRPGRFDRELAFPLPNAGARLEILKIHTKAWERPPPALLLEQLATRCVGYCGADLKALCTEAAVHALRRRYPQIHRGDRRLKPQPAHRSQAVRLGRSFSVESLAFERCFNLSATSSQSISSPRRCFNNISGPNGASA